MKDGNTQGALQFADLSRKLAGKRTLEKPWRLLYLLSKISDTPSSSAVSFFLFFFLNLFI